MSPQQKIFFITPVFAPHGGVVKIFDYACHANALGWSVTICCNREYSAELPLFQIGRFRSLLADKGVTVIPKRALRLEEDDLVFLSRPQDFEFLRNEITRTGRYDRVIHVIQSMWHANRSFLGGYATDLLSLPFSRIAITREVRDAIGPYVCKESLTRVIMLGHDTSYFFKRRNRGFKRKVRIGYTTWKSKIGDEIATRLTTHRPDEFIFQSISDQVSWRELRRLYHWADIFLATPCAEEGFYLPGLEAMSAGAIVVTPDAVGNRAYCDFGDNCVLAHHENAESYVQAIEHLRQLPGSAVDRIRAHAYETVGRHSLISERQAFDEFLQGVRGMRKADAYR